MPREYMVYYLIYGFVFIAMGFYVLQYRNDEQVRNPSFSRALPKLGLFGIIHGTTEWMTMILITGLFPEYQMTAVIIRSFLKVISFAFFLSFGIEMYWSYSRKRIRLLIIPWTLTGIWTLGFVYSLYTEGGYQGYSQLAVLNTFLMRYGMGLSAGILCFMAFRRDATIFLKQRKNVVAQKTNLLAYALLFYGLLDGVFVRGSDFFPANVINHMLFEEVTMIPVQLAKAAAGALILLWMSQLLRAFRDETRNQVQALIKNQTVCEERRKIGMTLHDGIIQKLYASGMKLEYLRHKHADKESEPILRDIKTEMNDAIEIVRKMLNEESQPLIQAGDFQSQLDHLVQKHQQTSKMNVHFHNRMPKIQMEKLTSEQTTQIYYVVQEALMNVLKHAEATMVWVSIELTLEALHVRIRDNGRGMVDKSMKTCEGKGISMMKERAEVISGKLSLKQSDAGTTVLLEVPWEG